jgi:hypothetical protein
MNVPTWLFLAIVTILVFVLIFSNRAKETYQSQPSSSTSFVYNTYTGTYEKAKF